MLKIIIGEMWVVWRQSEIKVVMIQACIVDKDRWQMIWLVTTFVEPIVDMVWNVKIEKPCLGYSQDMDEIIGALKEISDVENVNSNIDDAGLISQVNVVLID